MPHLRPPCPCVTEPAPSPGGLPEQSLGTPTIAASPYLPFFVFGTLRGITRHPLNVLAVDSEGVFAHVSRVCVWVWDLGFIGAHAQEDSVCTTNAPLGSAHACCTPPALLLLLLLLLQVNPWVAPLPFLRPIEARFRSMECCCGRPCVVCTRGWCRPSVSSAC